VVISGKRDKLVPGTQMAMLTAKQNTLTATSSLLLDFATKHYSLHCHGPELQEVTAINSSHVT
jgi:hypothetical protein